MAQENNKNTVSRQIYLPKDLNYEVATLKQDINHFEGKNLDLRDTCIELIRLGAAMKRKEIDEKFKK